MRLTLVVAGVIFIFVLGTLITAFAPLGDQSLWEASPRARPSTDLELKGRQVYIREGCWYCHSQYVRPVPADERQGWGQVSQAGDYAYRQPAVLGSERTGPDLMWIGDRLPSREWHLQHLYDPRSVSPGSIMPAYTWLFTGTDSNDKPIPTDEADALVAYLLSLTAGE